MITVGIIGANGQVGTEVCLFLNNWEQTKVIAICRNKLASVVLRKMNIECRIGQMKSVEDAKILLKDCDIVVDFSLPKGSSTEIKAVYKNNIQHALAAMPSNGKYIFISSLMAFGMGGKSNEFKNYLIPKTVYGSTKRVGEQIATNIGHKTGIEVYVLRLGEVHGLLQNCSKFWKNNQFDPNMNYIVPNEASYSVFCFTIAEAILNIADGKEKPGIYSLISNPVWTYKQLFDYLSESDINVTVNANYGEIKTSITSKIKSLVLRKIMPHKEMIQTYILNFAPNYEKSIKLNNWTNAISNKQNAYLNAFSEYWAFVKGVPPGKRILSISDSKSTMRKKTDICQKIIENLTKEVAS